MPASPNSVNLHVTFGDTLTYKKVSVPRRWTIGEVRDRAVTEMQSHLRSHNVQPDMPPSNQVQIFAQTHLKNKTALKDVNPSNDSESHDVLALIPTPPGSSLGDRFDSLIKKLEQRDHEHEKEMKEVRREISVLRAQQYETDSWIVQKDTKAFDKIVLRNLLDKAQAVLAHALGLSLLSESKRFLSLDWRRQFTGMDQHARHENVKAMLGALHTNPIAQQLSASATALNLLTEEFSRIRKDGDEVAHKDFIDHKRCTDAIERCKSIPEREALGLFFELVRTYRWE